MVTASPLRFSTVRSHDPLAKSNERPLIKAIYREAEREEAIGGKSTLPGFFSSLFFTPNCSDVEVRAVDHYEALVRLPVHRCIDEPG